MKLTGLEGNIRLNSFSKAEEIIRQLLGPLSLRVIEAAYRGTLEDDFGQTQKVQKRYSKVGKEISLQEVEGLETLLDDYY